MNIRIANRCIGCNVVVSRNKPYCFSCLNELKEKESNEMFSEFENKVLDKLKKEFGSLHDAMEEEIITEKVKVARNLYELSVEEFRQSISTYL